jgi:hypothetical protein
MLPSRALVWPKTLSSKFNFKRCFSESGMGLLLTRHESRVFPSSHDELETSSKLL